MAAARVHAAAAKRASAHGRGSGRSKRTAMTAAPDGTPGSAGAALAALELESESESEAEEEEVVEEEERVSMRRWFLHSTPN